MRLVIRFFGVANLIFAAWGFYFIFQTLKGYLRHAHPELENPPHFLTVFLTMTGINALFLILLVYAGIRLLQIHPAAVRFTLLVYLGEILWFFPIQPLLSLVPSAISSSVGAAGGVGDMGIAPQILAGYPLIGLIVLFLVHRKLARPAAPAAAIPDSSQTV